MSNPFANMSPEQVAEHNRRTPQGSVLPKTKRERSEKMTADEFKASLAVIPDHPLKASLHVKASRPKKPSMNQCESRFHEILKTRFPSAVITPQFRIRVSAWGSPVMVHYTADFLASFMRNDLVTHERCCLHTIYEVKDSRRKGHSDELTRPKLCREHNPWISRVVLAVWDGKEWTERVIA